MEEWRQAKCLPSTNNMDSDGVIATPLGSTRRTTVPWKEPPRQRLVLDSGTDYPLAGPECLVIHKHNTSISFSGAIPGDPFHKRDLVDVITWIITKDGQHILIKIVGAVDNTSNDSQETLLSPTHIRAGGHYVNDIQERHGGEEVVIVDGVTMPLSSNGVHLYYKCYKPSRSDADGDVVVVTQHKIFNPVAEANKAKTWTHQKGTTTSSSRRKGVSFSEHTLAQLHELDEKCTDHDNLIEDAESSPPHSNTRSLPTADLVGYKHNKNIPPHSGPKRTFCLKRSLTNPDVGIYVALEDQWIDECTPERKEELINFWQKRLYLSRERTLATLRNTTQMVGLLHSEHSRYLLRNSTKCRAPQLGSRRSPGTTYTDTAFASLTSCDGANAFQVFIHGTTSHLGIELLRSKKALPSAIINSLGRTWYHNPTR